MPLVGSVVSLVKSPLKVFRCQSATSFLKIEPVRLSAVSLALLLALACVPSAKAQLEQFGIQNGNSAQNAAAQQQMANETSRGSESGCTDPNASNCGGGGGTGAQSGNGSRQPSDQFNFQQPYQSNYYNNERVQPGYRFVPQAPTEFQRYVGETTGVWLQVFGASLFNGVPTTFAPVINAPVTPDYVVGPGDEILLQAWGQINFDLHLTVDRSGQVSIPHVGTVRVAGLKFNQLQDFLRQAIGKQFRNFDINVNLGQLRSIQVLVVGQARRPGNYTISSLSTLVNALFATGGPSVDGSMRHIQLRRDGQVVTELDLYDLLLRGDKAKDISLLPGDVIFIPVAGPRVAVFGSVDKPAIYELKDASETPASAVLALAGGTTTLASNKRAELERTDPGDSRHVVEVGLDSAGLATTLKDGDILRVYSMVPRFDNAVTLRGNVANPGRYAWHDGMKIRDVIPDRESLLTREYWRDRARLGLPVTEFTPTIIENPTAETEQEFNQRVVSGDEAARQQSQRAQVAQGRIFAENQASGANGAVYIGSQPGSQQNYGQQNNGQQNYGQQNGQQGQQGYGPDRRGATQVNQRRPGERGRDSAEQQHAGRCFPEFRRLLGRQCDGSAVWPAAAAEFPGAQSGRTAGAAD